MSLRHALLGILSAAPLTGYDLVQYFRDSVGYVWSAPKSQIYPELRKMAEQGLVSATMAPRGPRAQKRIYSITEDGKEEFARWAANRMEYPPDRDPLRLKAAFFDAAPFESARDQLRAHLAHYTRRLVQWQERAAALRARQTPLLQQRLKRRAEEDHDAITEFKAFAFDGNIARATAEIAWAERGLVLVDELEAGQDRAGKKSRGQKTVATTGARVP